MDIETIADKHFLPDYDDFPNLADELETSLYARGVKFSVNTYKPKEGGIDGQPYEVMVTTWSWPNSHGPLTREVFEVDLGNALEDFCEAIGDRIKDGFNRGFFKMNNNPPTSYGTAYHDFTSNGDITVRMVIEYKDLGLNGDDELGYGLNFHIVALLAKC